MQYKEPPEKPDKRCTGRLPTRAEIDAACEAIQATWTPAERERRRVYCPPRYEPPEYNSRELDEALAADRMADE